MTIGGVYGHPSEIPSSEGLSFKEQAQRKRHSPLLATDFSVKWFFLYPVVNKHCTPSIRSTFEEKTLRETSCIKLFHLVTHFNMTDG